MLQSLFCCFNRGIYGGGSSSHGPSPLPTYAEACRGPQEEGVGGGSTSTSLRAKHSADLEDSKSVYTKPSQSLERRQARFEEDRQPAITSGQIEIPENQCDMSKQVGFPEGNIIKSKTAGEVIDLVRLLDFDNDRIKALQAVASSLEQFTALETIDLVRSFDFDDGRIKALQAVASKLGQFTALEAIDMVRSFDFDNGRIKALQAVASKLGQFTALEAINLARSFDFDDGRIKALQAVASKLGQFTALETIDLAKSFDFDDGRIKALLAVESNQKQLI
ncbi:hypothetical protein N7471_010465 [Penicillium samsonianum]|uniref:uncharacterized protein n=1 Tax=Penicillium samsonianum TaxID=1882272 RepID=UPI002547124B|nr:uncharacterized protein N7471_010465 [Penicillium samsonianum]KAJ6125972.1 hypothetical protein N7471_010465 [Penicillium samsonianum]